MNDLDRRISVGPMMDWTDSGKMWLANNQLPGWQSLWHLYGTFSRQTASRQLASKLRRAPPCKGRSATNAASLTMTQNLSQLSIGLRAASRPVVLQ